MRLGELAALLTLVATAAVASPPPGVPTGLAAKADAWVVARAAAGEEVETLLVLAAQADLGRAASAASKGAAGAAVVERLRATARATQKPLLLELARVGVPHRAYWIVNMVWVRADAATLAALATRPDVARLVANPRTAFGPALPGGKGSCPPAVAPGLLAVGADRYWEAGHDGAGVVVAGADTGVDWTHPALRDAYRGWDGLAATHDRHWHDAIHTPSSVCGADSPEPCDDDGHGTHTLGTMVGDDGAHRVGMAPGARWIACRNMENGVGTPASYAECFEFFLAPTDLAGDDPDPALAPDVVNNSWSCTPAEGCGDPTVLRGAVEALRAAGIVVVAAAGNSGDACGSIDEPPATEDAAFTVAATHAAGAVAGFSSRGPVTVDGSGRRKPDLAAPGVGVCSTLPGGGFGAWSGTSMAAPHVAGLVALLVGAEPALRGDVDAIEARLRADAEPRAPAQACGGDVVGLAVPNHTYGDGLARAVPALFVDGFETGDVAAWSTAAP